MDLQAVMPRYVFVDESGDPSLKVDKEGVSDYFVLTAVIVEGDHLPDVQEGAQQLVRKYVGKGELRSRTVGRNLPRRRAILADISSLELRHYSQVIDKSRVFTDSGLRFKKSFLKFVHRTVYQNLALAFSDLHVVADEHGRTEFMLEFARYLGQRLPAGLFETSSFSFGSSHDYPLIQIADMICGSVARVYAGKDPLETLEPLRRITSLIDEWPPRLPGPLPPVDESLDQKQDRLVRDQALRAADHYVEKRSESEDIDARIEVAVLRYLLYNFRAVDPEEYIFTGRIHAHLREQGFDVSDRICRAAIARLRDNAVFIASSNRGIKIPYSVADLRNFVEQVDGKVVPYLKRLRITRDHFLTASGGELDIVSEERYPSLWALVRKLGI